MLLAGLVLEWSLIITDLDSSFLVKRGIHFVGFS